MARTMFIVWTRPPSPPGTAAGFSPSISVTGLNWKKYVKIDPRYFRPAEVDLLIGDPSKAKRKLKWKPKTTFKQLVKLMVDADIEITHRELNGINAKYISKSDDENLD